MHAFTCKCINLCEIYICVHCQNSNFLNLGPFGQVLSPSYIQVRKSCLELVWYQILTKEQLGQMNPLCEEVDISSFTRLLICFSNFWIVYILLQNFATKLQKLYDLGAQKFVLMSSYPLGCSPLSMAAQQKRKGCNKSHNEAALLFNANLRAMVNRITQQKPGPDVLMVNAYRIMQDIIRNPALSGKISNQCYTFLHLMCACSILLKAILMLDMLRFCEHEATLLPTYVNWCRRRNFMQERRIYM